VTDSAAPSVRSVPSLQVEDVAAGHKINMGRLQLVARGAMLLAALAVAGCSGSSQPAASGSAASGSGSATGSSQLQALQDGYAGLVRRTLPSVVEIRTSTGLGSGVVFDDQGDVVTNAHVVGTDNRFDVVVAGSSQALPATLVGSYAPNDLAVIKVNGAKGLRPASFADSSKLQVGDIVLAMGSPLGLSGSVTNGIVSALGRTVSEPTGPHSPGATLAGAIQTSAPINPGNSGGALVDASGQVVGLPTLAAVDQQIGQGGSAAPGIGFAIDSNTVKDIAAQLITHGGHVVNSHRAALGISAVGLADQAGKPTGVGIRQLLPGGAAAQAGLQVGDVIMSINGQQIPDLAALQTALAQLHVGQKVPIVVTRSGNQTTTQLTLGELPVH